MNIRALLHKPDDTSIQFNKARLVEARPPECGRVDIRVAGKGELDRQRWAAYFFCPEAYESSTGDVPQAR
jgi:hypothetical protein